MRSGFVLKLCGFGTFALFALILVSPKATIAPPAEPEASIAEEGVVPSDQENWATSDLPLSANSPATSIGRVFTGNGEPAQAEDPHETSRNEEHQANVEARVAELLGLSGKTDRRSMDTLLAEVDSPDQEIREAALDAISQSANRSVIPELLAIAEQTQDPGLKRAIAETVEFLKTPTLTEVLEGQVHQ